MHYYLLALEDSVKVSDNHLKELRKERNMEVKNILDDYENNSMDDLDTLDVTRRILEARSNSLERIESINKVLKLTSETNNALSTSVYINDELTNINIYFDNDIDLNADENTMLISMNTESLGDIKADVKINNVTHYEILEKICKLFFNENFGAGTNNGGGEEKEDEENDFLSTMAEAKKLSNFFE